MIQSKLHTIVIDAVTVNRQTLERVADVLAAAPPRFAAVGEELLDTITTIESEVYEQEDGLTPDSARSFMTRIGEMGERLHALHLEVEAWAKASES